MKPNYYLIGEVAKHCDKQKLLIAETQAWEYDLKVIFCDIWNDVKEDERIEKIWSLFSYARYVENSFFTDTGSGIVRKDHQNSFPTPLSELKVIANQYRSMAGVEVERYKNELCREREGSECICNGQCNKNGTHGTRIFEQRGKNLSRYDLLQNQRGR